MSESSIIVAKIKQEAMHQSIVVQNIWALSCLSLVVCLFISPSCVFVLLNSSSINESSQSFCRSFKKKLWFACQPSELPNCGGRGGVGWYFVSGARFQYVSCQWRALLHTWEAMTRAPPLATHTPCDVQRRARLECPLIWGL